MNIFLTAVAAADCCSMIVSEPFETDHDELLLAGIDPEKLGYMKKSEKYRILAAAGLNPCEYDF